jgi:hypothetical protein
MRKKIKGVNKMKENKEVKNLEAELSVLGARYYKEKENMEATLTNLINELLTYNTEVIARASSTDTFDFFFDDKQSYKLFNLYITFKDEYYNGSPEHTTGRISYYTTSNYDDFEEDRLIQMGKVTENFKNHKQSIYGFYSSQYFYEHLLKTREIRRQMYKIEKEIDELKKIEKAEKIENLIKIAKDDSIVVKKWGYIGTKKIHADDVLKIVLETPKKYKISIVTNAYNYNYTYSFMADKTNLEYFLTNLL